MIKLLIRELTNSFKPAYDACISFREILAQKIVDELQPGRFINVGQILDNKASVKMVSCLLYVKMYLR